MTLDELVTVDADGAPVTTYAEGAALPGGLLAWDRLGIGHRCETWLAWSPSLWCPAVVKFPRPHQLEHPRARAALRREVAALDGCLHPGLPRLYADGTGEPEPHVVVEYVDGPTLGDEVDENGPLAPGELALVAVHLLSALRTVHARGLVHVDVKPDNVVLRAGRAVLLDLGSARRIGAPQPPGMLIGSPGYAAPELEAGAPITPAMDVYGLGVTLHEALTGLPSFDPDLPAAERPAPPALRGSPAAAIVDRLLEPDPAARPDVDRALREFAAIADPAGELICPPWARA